MTEDKNGKSIFSKIEFYNLIVLIITLIVLGLYTVYTRDIANEAIKSNQIGSRPLLGLTIDDTPFKFINMGNGPALNISIIQANKDGKMLSLKQSSIVGGLGINGNGKILQTDLEESTLVDIIKKYPYAKNFIANKKGYSYIAIIYEDVFGNHFASVHNVGELNEFSKFIEFIELK